MKEEVKEEEQKIEEIKEENNNKINEKEIIEEDKNKKKEFVPHEIKERKIEEEPWTVIKKGNKKKKPH